MARKKVARGGIRVTDKCPGSVLAFDLSSSCVGWAVFHNGLPCNWGKVSLGHEEHDLRLREVHNLVLQLVADYLPSEVVLEEPYLGRARHAHVLLLYLGVVLCTLVQLRGVPLPVRNRIPPRTVKKVMNLPHKGEYADRKRQAVTRCNKLFGLRLRYKENDRDKKVSDDDVADALLVGAAWHVLHCGATYG